MEKKKKDAYEKFSGDFKATDEFEEELEEEGVESLEAEREHFEEEAK